ncbi:hypothetical protein SK128_012793, partial [Halocaridina rubra]
MERKSARSGAKLSDLETLITTLIYASIHLPHAAWDAFPNLTVLLAHSNTSAFSITVPPQSYLRPSPDSFNETAECWILGIEESQSGTVL